MRLDLFLFLFRVDSRGLDLFLSLLDSHPRAPTGIVSGTDSEKSWSWRCASAGQERVEQSTGNRRYSPNCSVDGTKGDTEVDDKLSNIEEVVEIKTTAG